LRRFGEDEYFIISMSLKRMEGLGNDEIDEIRGRRLNGIHRISI